MHTGVFIKHICKYMDVSLEKDMYMQFLFIEVFKYGHFSPKKDMQVHHNKGRFGIKESKTNYMCNLILK